MCMLDTCRLLKRCNAVSGPCTAQWLCSRSASIICPTRLLCRRNVPFPELAGRIWQNVQGSGLPTPAATTRCRPARPRWMRERCGGRRRSGCGLTQQVHFTSAAGIRRRGWRAVVGCQHGNSVVRLSFVTCRACHENKQASLTAHPNSNILCTCRRCSEAARCRCASFLGVAPGGSARRRRQSRRRTSARAHRPAGGAAASCGSPIACWATAAAAARQHAQQHAAAGSPAVTNQHRCGRPRRCSLCGPRPRRQPG